MISEFIAGMLGTMAFSILFGVPSRYYVYCGLIGSGGWIIYSVAVKVLGAAEASLLATMAVIFFSRLAAVWKRCPVTIFLIAGIFPLVPGSGIYWTTYYLVTDQLLLALHRHQRIALRSGSVGISVYRIDSCLTCTGRRQKQQPH